MKYKLFCSLLISISHVSVKNQFENGLCELNVEIASFFSGALHSHLYNKRWKETRKKNTFNEHL